MDFTGTTNRTFEARSRKIDATLKVMFDAVPDDGTNEPFQQAINGVLFVNTALGHVFNVATNGGMIQAGVLAFEQILMDLIEGRADDDRNGVYRLALSILRG